MYILVKHTTGIVSSMFRHYELHETGDRQLQLRLCFVHMYLIIHAIDGHLCFHVPFIRVGLQIQ